MRQVLPAQRYYSSGSRSYSDELERQRNQVLLGISTWAEQAKQQAERWLNRICVTLRKEQLNSPTLSRAISKLSLDDPAGIGRFGRGCLCFDWIHWCSY